MTSFIIPFYNLDLVVGYALLHNVFLHISGEVFLVIKTMKFDRLVGPLKVYILSDLKVINVKLFLSQINVKRDPFDLGEGLCSFHY